MGAINATFDTYVPFSAKCVETYVSFGAQSRSTVIEGFWASWIFRHRQKPSI